MFENSDPIKEMYKWQEKLSDKDREAMRLFFEDEKGFEKVFLLFAKVLQNYINLIKKALNTGCSDE